jgi:hypothetical protein
LGLRAKSRGGSSSIGSIKFYSSLFTHLIRKKYKKGVSEKGFQGNWFPWWFWAKPKVLILKIIMSFFPYDDANLYRFIYAFAPPKYAISTLFPWGAALARRAY